ncbi:MAG: hypothetical protein ACK40G_01100 [Cytophagaceae bacterium]
MQIQKKFLVKAISLFLAINILTQICFPTAVFALTAGPSSPEFSSFEPVATTDMVNVFSGDFTYNLPVINIPGPDGGGYALSLSYHSGANVEEEASWVGYGWSLNPGAINRGVRGFPDDYNNTPVKQYNRSQVNWTATAHDKLGLEFFSKSDWELVKDTQHEPQSSFPSIELTQTIRFNNYQGFNRTYSIGGGFKGAASLNMQVASSGITFSASLNVAGILNRLKHRAQVKALEAKKKEEPAEKVATETAPTQQQEASENKPSAAVENARGIFKKIKGGIMSNAGISTYGLTAFESSQRAQVTPQYKGFGMNFNTSFQANPSQAPIGVELGWGGTFNMQHNVPVSDYVANGYIHSLNKNDYKNENVPKLSDYFLEKQSDFDQRDIFIGIPFANYDMFSLTGEGLSGGFRMHNLSSGHYYPNYVQSNITSLNTGVEVMVGTNIGVGLNFGVGNSKFRVKDWGKPGNAESIQFDKSKEAVARFTNDLGGKVEFSNSNSLETANLIVNPNIPFIKGASPNVPSFYNYVNNSAADQAARNLGRSSYIKPLKKDNTSGDRITGFEIVKEDGSKYEYGRPVYTKNEIQLSVDVHPDRDEILDKKLAFKSTPISSNGVEEGQLNSYKTVVGESRMGEGAKYATSYLLTQITTADYVDVNNNGADNMDFGGWTKFEYDKIHDNYRWKIPYVGLNYSANQISTKKDDVGSISTGEKEVHLLRKISTKTHTAYFITNKSNAGYSGVTISNQQRLDGLSGDLSTSDKTRKGNNEMERLEKIILVANSRPNKPIKIVNFAYSYELVKNVPNNLHSNFPLNSTNPNSGKLTLKKVWFDYEGVINARVSPYEFFYRYKDKHEFSTDIQSKYAGSIGDFFNLSNIYSDAAQNPSYSPHFIDAWGFNQALGKEQSLKMRDWKYQGNLPANANYDPAAYQLKQIKLPSGGEILVEYEEKDYRYVQDRDVMAMVSLKSFVDGVGHSYNKSPQYTLNLDEIGVTDLSTKQKIAQKLEELYANDRGRIYFKFLFQLVGDNVPQINDCKSEYIDGYARVKEAKLVGSDVVITLDGAGSGYDTGDRNYSLTPRQGCYDYYSTNRIGKYFDNNSECESNLYDGYTSIVQGLADEGESNDNLAQDMITFLQKMGFAIGIINFLHSDILNHRVQPPPKGDVCRNLNKDLSYFKIPMCKAKKGGGIRVKRLLTYDPGFSDGEGDVGVIYGSNYYYQDEDGLSSGVATNEPSSMREENPLVEFIPKRKQSWFSRHTIGKDKEQTEGPIGESLLPGASVGHSRVVVENIFQGKSGVGFTIHNYNTAKDYPLDKSYDRPVSSNSDGRVFELTGSGVEYSNILDNLAKDNAPINAGVFSYNSKKLWATQGFRFIVNNMHGQPKSVASYTGKYSTYKTNRDKVFLVSAQEFTYFEPGEKVRVLKKNSNGAIIADWDSPGKEMDVAMDMRSLKERILDFTLEVDISIGLSTPPPPFLTFMPVFEYTENIISLHSTSKVISYPVIQKSVKVYQDGVWTATDYLAFDEATGQPLVTRNTDIYDKAEPNCLPHNGSIYNILVPAYWYYPEMGRLSEVDGIEGTSRSNQISLPTGTYITYGANGNPITQSGSFQIPLSAIIDAKIQTFNKGQNISSWFDQSIKSDYGISGDLTALNKIYRPYQQYVFKTNVTSINAQPVYNSGLYSSFVPFNYNSTSQSGNWIKTSEVVKYSPHGMPLEETDVLNIPSSARFGYGNTMPIAVSNNCEYNSLYFQDFENSSAASGSGHSGKKSMAVSSFPFTVLQNMPLTNHVREKGAILMLWLKTDQPLKNYLALNISSSPAKAKGVKVAQTGEWSLYYFEISHKHLASIEESSVNFTLEYDKTNENIYIDDVRYQPLDAQVSCYVYDPASLRLIAQFDDQHFGLYYQYNDEGKLVRKLVETERGLKTIQETQYNTKKVDRKNIDK